MKIKEIKNKFINFSFIYIGSAVFAFCIKIFINSFHLDNNFISGLSWLISYYLWIKDYQYTLLLNFTIITLLLFLFIYFLLKIYNFSISRWKKQKYFVFSDIFLIIIWSFSIYYVNINYIFFIIAIISIIFTMIIENFIDKKQNKISSKKDDQDFFLCDEPIDLKDQEQDILWYKDIWDNLAKTICKVNTDNFVISLESSWWDGKTTFLNYVLDDTNLKQNYNIFRFDMRLYNNEVNIFNVFISQFSKYIYENYNLPEFDKKLNSFLNASRWINIWFNMFWFSVSKSFNENLTDIKNNIRECSEKLDKKILIVLDDIDRIWIDKVKEFFKIAIFLKSLKNVVIIPCYDVNNLNAIDVNILERKINIRKPLELKNNSNQNNITEKDKREKINWNIEEFLDNSNLIEFIEKIVNIKYGLPVRIQEVKNFFIHEMTDMDKWIMKIFKFAEWSIKWIRDWIDRLFNTENFEIYEKYICNIRKIKRLINSIKLILKLEHSNIPDIFDEKEWLSFDDFIKFYILYLYHDNIYKYIIKSYKLNKEPDIFSRSKLIFWLSYSLEGESKYVVNKNLYNYIESLKKEERVIIENLFLNKKIEGGLTSIEDHKNRIYVNLWRYIDITNNIDDVTLNVFINQKLDIFKDNIEGFTFDEILKKYWVEWINRFIRKFGEKNFDHKHWEKIIDLFLKDFREDKYYWVNADSLLFNTLNDFIWKNGNNYDNTKIKKYIYWPDENNRGIIERLLSDDWRIRWGLYFIFKFLLIARRDREKFYRRYEEAIREKNLTEEGDSMYYLSWIAKFIWEKIKQKYIEWEKNIFEDLYYDSDADKQKDINWKGIFVIHRLTSKKEWIGYFDESFSYDQNNHEIFNILNNYYFDLFNKEWWLKYFFKIIGSMTDYPDKITSPHDHIEDHIKEIIDNIIDKEKLKSFLKDKETEINDFLKQHWWEIYYWLNIDRTYKDVYEVFENYFENM